MAACSFGLFSCDGQRESEDECEEEAEEEVPPSALQNLYELIFGGDWDNVPCATASAAEPSAPSTPVRKPTADQASVQERRLDALLKLSSPELLAILGGKVGAPEAEGEEDSPRPSGAQRSVRRRSRRKQIEQRHLDRWGLDSESSESEPDAALSPQPYRPSERGDLGLPVLEVLDEEFDEPAHRLRPIARRKSSRPTLARLDNLFQNDQVLI